MIFSGNAWAAILVPSCLRQGLKWRSDQDAEFNSLAYVSTTVLGTLGVLSSYFVHVDRGIHIVQQTSHYSSRVISKMKSLGVSVIVTCCDLNTQISANCGSQSGNTVWKDVTSGAHEERELLFLDVLAEPGLSAMNTFSETFGQFTGLTKETASRSMTGDSVERCYTRMDFGEGDRFQQIDYSMFALATMIVLDWMNFRKIFCLLIICGDCFP